jgi:hypothetical protein
VSGRTRGIPALGVAALAAAVALLPAAVAAQV